jgi:3-hydroxyisobutyrate dehydrogenase
MQCGLQYSDVQDLIARRDRSGVRGDEVADDFGAELARNLALDLPLARATKEQYDRMIAEGLGDLDKSGMAEFTFKDRHKHSGDRV